MDAKASLIQTGCHCRALEPSNVGQDALAVVEGTPQENIAVLATTAAYSPSSESEPDHAGFGEVNIEDWLETQLLDCQNLARQKGMVSLASMLDAALELLNSCVGGRLEANQNASLAKAKTGIVVPFRLPQGS